MKRPEADSFRPFLVRLQFHKRSDVGLITLQAARTKNCRSIYIPELNNKLSEW